MINNFPKAFSPLNMKLNIMAKKAMDELMTIIRIELDTMSTRPSIRKIKTVKIPDFQCCLDTKAEDIPTSPIIVNGHPMAHFPNWTI